MRITLLSNAPRYGQAAPARPSPVLPPRASVRRPFHPLFWLVFAWLVLPLAELRAQAPAASPDSARVRFPAASRVQTAVHSAVDKTRWLAKRRQFTYQGVPYGFTSLPALYLDRTSAWNYGGRANLSDYSNSPFLYRMSLSWSQSTRGKLDLFFRLNVPSLGGTGWGFLLQMDFSRGLRSYYGQGNDAVVDSRFTDPRSPLFRGEHYYAYRIHKPRMLFTLVREIRRPLFLAVGFGLKHVRIRQPEGPSLLFEHRPFGIEGGSSGLLGAMLRWDTRDDETIPRRGTLHEWSYETAHNSLLGLALPTIGFSRYTFSDLRYIPLSPRLHLAHRAIFEIMQGEVPVDVSGDLGGLRRKIRGLGGDETLRGFPVHRFVDDVRFLANEEVRCALYSHYFLHQFLEWNGVLFADLGRVWPDLDSLQLTGLHASGGFGLRLYWNEDFVIRVESHFSSEQRLVRASLGNIY